MEFKILTSHSASDLSVAVNKHIAEGWKPKGSHNVVTKNELKRFSGNQHKDTVYTVEYSQTMIKKIKKADIGLEEYKPQING